jgi:preprotein translocase subunit SecD
VTNHRILAQTALAFTVLLIAGCSLLPFRKTEKVPKVRIEVRFAESAPRDSYKAMKFHGAKITVYVAPDTQFTNRDIIGATVDKGEGILQSPIITLTLTKDAANRLANITVNKYHNPLAVIFNDKVMAVLTGNEPVISGRLVFSGRFTGKEAEEFVKQINSELPPPPQ